MRELLFLSFLLSSLLAHAQLNATLRSNLDYSPSVNDVWGYVAPDGTEYAIVGLETGVSFVSLADPDNAKEVARINGDRSVWRDMKTYGEYAYIVADQGDEGLTVVDLSRLPDTVTFTNNRYDVPGFDRPFIRAHNIYIDTTMGLAFTAGGDRNLNDGGMLIFDLKADPAHPPLVAVGPEIYSHDVYVQDSIMYASEIYRGELALYDIRDINNIVELGRTMTPSEFTHNSWANAAGTTVFTTDEVGDAPVAAFDIQDPSDIKRLDEYRPIGTINMGVIPHNVHVIGDWLSISYYTDGLRVVDASDPTNLVEVANYDTWDGADGGFNGNWGAYPFLPSGLTLVSDRQTGLYVVDVDYKLAARLEGRIYDATTNADVNEAEITISSEQPNRAFSDAMGNYATGLADEGTYTVTVSKAGYLTNTTTTTLTNGTTTELDIALTALSSLDLSVSIVADDTGMPVPNAVFDLRTDEIDYMATSDDGGQVAINTVYDYEYDLIVTAWGYRGKVLSNVRPSDLAGTTITLERGYEDDFVSDLGWTISGNAQRGRWERGQPAEKLFENRLLQPGFDAPGDLGDEAYFTGLEGGSAGAGDVDNGSTVLTSPIFDLTTYTDSVYLSYHYWFANTGGEFRPDDSLTVSITNGETKLLLATYRDWTSQWERDTFLLNGLLPFTENMQLIVRTEDTRTVAHVVEAGFDKFRITDLAFVTSVDPTGLPLVKATYYPNPSLRDFTLSYDLQQFGEGRLRVYSSLGRLVEDRILTTSTGNFRFGETLRPGLYVVEITAGGKRVHTAKLLKE